MGERNKIKCWAITSWNGLWNISDKLKWPNLWPRAGKTWGAAGEKFFKSEGFWAWTQATDQGQYHLSLRGCLPQGKSRCSSLALWEDFLCMWMERAASRKSSEPRSPGPWSGGGREITAEGDNRRKRLNPTMKSDRQLELITVSTLFRRQWQH